jgi:hypothetical protein
MMDTYTMINIYPGFICRVVAMEHKDLRVPRKLMGGLLCTTVTKKSMKSGISR